MPAIIASDTLRSTPSRTARFDGVAHGSPVSFFLVENEPGQGSALHVHPYIETWIVRSGEVEFTVGQEKLRARGGDIVVGPAGVPHKFVNVGTGQLELVGIHASDRILQDLVDESASA